MTRVLVLGDLHVGSVDAICPPTVQLGKANRRYTYNASDMQTQMYDKWCQMCDVVQPDITIINGDLCEGVNYKDNGVGAWTTDKNQQIDTCVELLQMLDCDKFIGTQGSNYHTENNMSLDNHVTKRLNGTFGTEMFVNVEGVRFHVRHTTPFRKQPQMQAFGIVNDMINAEYDKDTFGNTDVFIRSHMHRYSFVGWNGALGMICPAWKWRDGFVKSRNVMSNDLGFVVFDVTGDEYKWTPKLFKIKNAGAIDEYQYKPPMKL